MATESDNVVASSEADPEVPGPIDGSTVVAADAADVPRIPASNTVTEALRSKSKSFATYIKGRTEALQQKFKKSDSGAEQAMNAESAQPAAMDGGIGKRVNEIYDNFVTTASAAASDIGKRTKQGGLWAYHVTTAGIKKLTTPSRRVKSICRLEGSIKPCPQLIITCCTVIVTKGLSTEGIFKQPAPQDKVEKLCSHFDSSMVLPPSEIDPLLAASAIKLFLHDLDEPLLLSNFADLWVAAGSDLDQVPSVLASLPLPNLSTLRVLMDTCYRVAAQSNLNGMNALGLAEQLVPALLWRRERGRGLSMPGLAALSNIQLPNMAALKAKVMRKTSPTSDAGAPAEEAAGAASPEAAATSPRSSASASQEPGLPASTMAMHSTELGALAEQDMAEDDEEEVEPGSKVALGPEDLEAVVRVLEHMVINFDDLF